MKLLYKLFAGGLLASAVTLPYMASSRGWGLHSERNAKIVKEMQKQCPRRDAFGNCVRSHRSYFYGRSAIGGGPRGGK